MKPSHCFFWCLISLVLLSFAGCSSGAGAATSQEMIRAPRIYTPKLASDLVDHSGEVQSVQGIDPRTYFVANEIALNAVDADGDGIWDDVMERLKDDPIWNEVDNKVLVQLIIGLQNETMTKSVAEVVSPRNKRMLAVGCFLFTTNNDLTYKIKIDKRIKSAFFTSKARILAYKYGDFLANGQSFSGYPVQAESCQ